MITTLKTIAIFFLALSCGALGQENKSKQTDDTIRITTELVQTGVIVLDKQGRFVDGLKPEQFELRVDGKPLPIGFFERVVSGSIEEEKAQLSARGSSTSPTAPPPTLTSQGRTIIFFIDDFHLSASGVDRTKKAILQ